MGSDCLVSDIRSAKNRPNYYTLHWLISYDGPSVNYPLIDIVKRGITFYERERKSYLWLPKKTPSGFTMGTILKRICSLLYRTAFTSFNSNKHV
jgi:hypothetical protein